jgi:hypothetical protein
LSTPKTALAAPFSSGYFRPLDQDGSEHQAKETTLLQGEIKVGETDSGERIAFGRACAHRSGEFSEPFRSDRRKKILLVGKMAIGGSSGHSDTARRLLQANDVWAGFLQDRSRRRAQGVREIATVMGPSRRIRKTFHIQPLGRQIAPKIRVSSRHSARPLTATKKAISGSENG